MKLKLDKNIDARLAILIRDAGHDAMTVREQDLHGSDDADLTGCAYPKIGRS